MTKSGVESVKYTTILRNHSKNTIHLRQNEEMMLFHYKQIETLPTISGLYRFFLKEHPSLVSRH